MEGKYEEILNYISLGKYPEGYSKGQKAALKRYAEKFTLREGQLFFRNRKVVQFRTDARKLFDEFHSSPIGGHTGTVKTRSAMCSRFYWYGMSVDIDTWVSECDSCQQSGKALTAAQPLEIIKVSAVWELLEIGLTGPLPKTADGYQYIFTATDYFSKWVEAFPLKTKSASEVTQKVCQIIYRHGCPKRILSDQGREFVNKLNRNLCGLLGIERRVTAAYPQTNGLDEKTNDNIKRALTKLVNDRQNNWDVYLDAVLFSLRSKVHTSSKHTPFMLMYGREAVFPSKVPVNVPLSFSLPEEDKYTTFLDEKRQAMEKANKSAHENISKAQLKQRLAFEKRVLKKHKDMVYTVGQEVLLFNMRKRGRKGVAMTQGGAIQVDNGTDGVYGLQTLTMANAAAAQPGATILHYAGTNDGKQTVLPSNQVVAQSSSSTVSSAAGDVTQKREVRRMKNREAARQCRRKKKEYVRCLENSVAALQKKNQSLVEELASFKDFKQFFN